MSTYVLTVQFRILTLCLNYWVGNLTLQTLTCQTGFNYTIQGRVVQSWVKITQGSARFEFTFESLKSISVLILFVYKLIIGSSKNNRENYPSKCIWTQEKETRVTFNPGLSANRPSNNWAQNTTLLTRCMRKLLDVNSHSLFPAKVYFLIKWTDKSIGYKQTAILKLLYLNPVL